MTDIEKLISTPIGGRVKLNKAEVMVTPSSTTVISCNTCAFGGKDSDARSCSWSIACMACSRPDKESVKFRIVKGGIV